MKQGLKPYRKPGQLPFRFDRIGSWWNQKGDEIDIVALNSETAEILFAECKWHAAAVGCGVVEDLRRKATLVDWKKCPGVSTSRYSRRAGLMGHVWRTARETEC